jgi:hypothetical protein
VQLDHRAMQSDKTSINGSSGAGECGTQFAYELLSSGQTWVSIQQFNGLGFESFLTLADSHPNPLTFGEPA